MYFETKTKKTQEGKKVSEHHIMKATCFTDAEATTIMNFGENEEFKITHIAESKIKEIINPEQSVFYRVTASFVSVDEASGKEKTIKEQYLFGAACVDEVKVYIDLWLSESVVPTEIKSIVETKIGGVLS